MLWLLIILGGLIGLIVLAIALCKSSARREAAGEKSWAEYLRSRESSSTSSSESFKNVLPGLVGPEQGKPTPGLRGR